MTRNPKYPLEPLRQHRDRKVASATSELGDAVRAREAADRAQRRAEQERLDAEARAEAVRQDEAARLVRGELCVADLARAQAWEHAVSVEAFELGRQLERARTHVSTAREAEGNARADLASKKADLDVVVKDETRFDAGLRRARDAAEEEAAEDAFAGRRRDA
jgi:hypothetical protein